MKHWKYKNITFLLFSFIFAYYIFRINSLHSFLLHLGNFGYVGAFVAGILFVSTYTVATGVIILLILTETMSPVEIGLFAGIGAVVGDYTIFCFVKDGLMKEIKNIYNKIDKKNHFKKILHTKYFSWLLPVVGALIIASPLPDEIGVSLMGISKMKTYQFVLLSFVLNAIGIFILVSTSLLINK